MKRIVKIILTGLLLQQCVYPVELDSQEPKNPTLIVEGFVTTQPGPHFLSINRVGAYGSVFEGVITVEEKASVIIRDDMGNVTLLVESNPGIYQTNSDFSAETGRSYSLQIQTADGSNYISFPQPITPSPEIENLEMRFVKNELDNGSFTSGIETLVTFQDPSDQVNHYMWYASDGVYPYIARPDLYGGGSDISEPGLDPIPCIPDSGVNSIPQYAFRFERNFKKSKYPELAPGNPSCVLYEDRNFDFLLESDQFNNGNEIQKSVTFIADDGMRFVNRYRFLLHQVAINQEAYNFYQSINILELISGNIFDPPPIEIRGNIVSVDNPDEAVIGFFGAFDEKVEEIYIDSRDLPEKQPEAIWQNDYWKLDSSTQEVPEWWQGPAWN